MTTGDLARILATGEDGSAVLARGLAILQIVRESGGLTAQEISTRSGIPRATVYRLVEQLQAAGFLVEYHGRHHPGRQLSGMHAEGRHLVDFAHPILHALATETGLAAVLSVRVHHLALTLDGVAGPKGRRAAFVVGQTHGLHAGASAKPLLAFAPASVTSAVLAGSLRQYTANTPTAVELPERLARIREQGFDVSHGERQPEWSAVGMPVPIDDTPACCLSLAAPRHAFDEAAMLDALRDAVRRLVESVPSDARSALWQSSAHPEGAPS